MKPKDFQWLTTAPNPRVHPTGYDQGQRGWKLHAVAAPESAAFKDVRFFSALCGLRPAHGWSLDLFIQDRCARCQAKQEAIMNTTATVKLNAWELLAIETALREVKGFDQGSKNALIEKIQNAKPKEKSNA